MHPFRAVNGEWFGPPVERHGLDEAEDTEEMVCMPVGDKYCIDGKSAPRTHHLLLRTFAAVKEERVRAPADHDAGRVPLGVGSAPAVPRK